MRKILHGTLSFFIALSLNIKANSSEQTTESDIATFVAVEAYIPSFSLKNNEERLSRGTVVFHGELKSVYEVFRRNDGTCYKQTIHLHGIREFTKQFFSSTLELFCHYCIQFEMSS